MSIPLNNEKIQVYYFKDASGIMNYFWFLTTQRKHFRKNTGSNHSSRTAVTLNQVPPRMALQALTALHCSSLAVPRSANGFLIVFPVPLTGCVGTSPYSRGCALSPSQRLRFC